jgi:hypothetical protein
MVEPHGSGEVTLGTLHQDLSALRSETREGFSGLRHELAGILREMAGSMREMITIQQHVVDELRGVNTRLDNFARGRGDGAPPV